MAKATATTTTKTTKANKAAKAQTPALPNLQGVPVTYPCGSFANAAALAQHLATFTSTPHPSAAGLGSTVVTLSKQGAAANPRQSARGNHLTWALIKAYLAANGGSAPISQLVALCAVARNHYCYVAYAGNKLGYLQPANQ